MKLFTTTTDRRTTDGLRLDGYPISSPCEPNSSGELIIYLYILRYGMSVLAVSSYRSKTAFQYLADTNVYDYKNTPVNIFFAVLKRRCWSSTLSFLLNVRKGGFVAL